MIQFPKPLRRGDLIAVTAPSSGVAGAALDRLDLVLEHLRDQGLRVVEGECLRMQQKNASAPAERRAAELSAFFNADEVSAIFPPWGGELATQVLERIDFEALQRKPAKWFLGFSDLSTIQLPLTLISGWATAHGPNLMDLAPTQTDPLTTATMSILGSTFAEPVLQHASQTFQKTWIRFEDQVDAALNLTEVTEWKRLDGLAADLDFSGVLIGGCLDTIAWLAGTRFGDVPSFIRQNGRAGTIVYLENAEMSPPALVRALTALRRHGWFSGVSGVLIGRSAGPDAAFPDDLSHADAIRSVLKDLPAPVLIDVDIGHQPPQFTLVNGAHAAVRFGRGAGSIVQQRAAA